MNENQNHPDDGRDWSENDVTNNDPISGGKAAGNPDADETVILPRRTARRGLSPASEDSPKPPPESDAEKTQAMGAVTPSRNPDQTGGMGAVTPSDDPDKTQVMGAVPPSSAPKSSSDAPSNSDPDLGQPTQVMPVVTPHPVPPQPSSQDGTRPPTAQDGGQPLHFVAYDTPGGQDDAGHDDSDGSGGHKSGKVLTRLLQVLSALLILCIGLVIGAFAFGSSVNRATPVSTTTATVTNTTTTVNTVTATPSVTSAPPAQTVTAEAQTVTVTVPGRGTTVTATSVNPAVTVTAPPDTVTATVTVAAAAPQS